LIVQVSDEDVGKSVNPIKARRDPKNRFDVAIDPTIKDTENDQGLNLAEQRSE
jgi:hypothetical protein